MLYAGIVLTGGGSQLRQLDQAFKDMMPSMRQPRIVTEPACGVVWNEARWKKGDGSQLALLSVMAKGDVNCCELPKMDAIDNLTPEEQDKVVQGSLFTDDLESAQEERDRKEQEERDRKEQEAIINEEAKKEEPVQSGVKKNNVFKRWYDSFMNMGENFFDDKDESRNDGNAN